MLTRAVKAERLCCLARALLPRGCRGTEVAYSVSAKCHVTPAKLHHRMQLGPGPVGGGGRSNKMWINCLKLYIDYKYVADNYIDADQVVYYW